MNVTRYSWTVLTGLIIALSVIPIILLIEALFFLGLFHLSGLLKILPGGPLKKLATHFFWVLRWLEKGYMTLELLVLTLHYS